MEETGILGIDMLGKRGVALTLVQVSIRKQREGYEREGYEGKDTKGGIQLEGCF